MNGKQENRALAPVYERPDLHGRVHVFVDREQAGEVLAEMLAGRVPETALVMGIPSGGVPVAVACARRLGLPLEVAVVSKVLLPWTTEAGFGAVAFDGSVWLNEDYIRAYGLDEETVARQVAAAREKVERRVRRFRGTRPLPDLAGRTVVLVDDGIAAGSTMLTAIRALRRLDAGEVVVAVPTAHDDSLLRVAAEADGVYCANVREGGRFAVVEAYVAWRDVPEDEAVALYRSLQGE